MRYILKLIFIFSITFIKGQTEQNLSEIEVKYNFTYVTDTLNKTPQIPEPMVLLTNGRKSIYYSENYKAVSESWRKQLEAPVSKGEIRTISFQNPPQARVKHSVYKDENNVYISNFLRDLYTFKSTDILSWKIHSNETKDILGYKCIKATVNVNNKNYTAWFTYDIPINDGPYKFKGLPGLILKLDENHGYFNFEAVSITKTNLPIEFRKGIVITKEQYLKKRDEYISDPSQGKIRTPEYRKIVEENKKRYNNSLE